MKNLRTIIEGIMDVGGIDNNTTNEFQIDALNSAMEKDVAEFHKHIKCSDNYKEISINGNTLTISKHCPYLIGHRVLECLKNFKITHIITTSLLYIGVIDKLDFGGMRIDSQFQVVIEGLGKNSRIQIDNLNLSFNTIFNEGYYIQFKNCNIIPITKYLASLDICGPGWIEIDKPIESTSDYQLRINMDMEGLKKKHLLFDNLISGNYISKDRKHLGPIIDQTLQITTPPEKLFPFVKWNNKTSAGIRLDPKEGRNRLSYLDIIHQSNRPDGKPQAYYMDLFKLKDSPYVIEIEPRLEKIKP